MVASPADQRPDALDRLEPDLVGHAGKRLADVEGLAVAVELAMVVVGEGGIGLELAGEQAARQRHARDHGDLARLGDVEEQPGRALPEDVEDDLDADHARIFDRLQGLLDPLDADAVVADLARGLEPVERVERLRVIIKVGRRAVELDEVERLDLEVFQAPVDPAAEVLVAVAGDRLLRQAAAGLGGDEDVGGSPRLQDLGDDPLRAAVAIDVGRVDEGDAGVERGVERRDRVALLDLAPAPADRPGAEPDLADAAAGASKLARCAW